MQHPIPGPGILNVHELGADRAGINFGEARNQFPQRHLLAVGEKFRGNSKIEIFFAEPKLAQRKQWVFRTLVRQRIHSRDGMAESPISVNQTVDSGLQRTFPRGRARGAAAVAPFFWGKLPSSNPSKNAAQLGSTDAGSCCQR